MKRILLAALLAVPGLAQAALYTITDEGDFVPAGRAVEFSDRYGWDHYKIRFDFSLDGSGRALKEGSQLALTVIKRDGKTWEYRCRNIAANVNYMRLHGMSVVAECRIDADSFSRAVGLHRDDVGDPRLVFQAIVQDGQARPGAQCGVYFRPSVRIESHELKDYASRDDAPSQLSLLFRSRADS